MVNAVLAIICILGIGFLGTFVATRLRVPHSVFLVVLGVAAGMYLRGSLADHGESLLNDGTAIVLFRVLIAAAATPDTPMLADGLVRFVVVSLGGGLVGYVLAQATVVLLRLTHASGASQLGLTVVAAYLSFIIA